MNSISLPFQTLLLFASHFYLFFIMSMLLLQNNFLLWDEQTNSILFGSVLLCWLHLFIEIIDILSSIGLLVLFVDWFSVLLVVLVYWFH